VLWHSVNNKLQNHIKVWTCYIISMPSGGLVIIQSSNQSVTSALGWRKSTVNNGEKPSEDFISRSLWNSLTYRCWAKRSPNKHLFASLFNVSGRGKLQRSSLIRKTLEMETSEISVGLGNLHFGRSIEDLCKFREVWLQWRFRWWSAGIWLPADLREDEAIVINEPHQRGSAKSLVNIWN
jgi:hypothetical protein